MWIGWSFVVTDKWAFSTEIPFLSETRPIQVPSRAEEITTFALFEIVISAAAVARAWDLFQIAREKPVIVVVAPEAKLIFPVVFSSLWSPTIPFAKPSSPVIVKVMAPPPPTVIDPLLATSWFKPFKKIAASSWLLWSSRLIVVAPLEVNDIPPASATIPYTQSFCSSCANKSIVKTEE